MRSRPSPDLSSTPGLILSLFPGVDLLGRGFEAEGFAVVRGPDQVWGGDVRGFHVPPGRFDGVIGGSPCQDFSLARRAEASGYGLEMLREFGRVVLESRAGWFLLENVPTVPNITIPGYSIQRFDLNARDCGSPQRRNRHFQFGSLAGLALVPGRIAITGEPAATCLATEGRRKERRTWADFCELQGLPRDFALPGLSREASYRAVGNGVNVLVARTVARAIIVAKRDGLKLSDVSLCICGCGRLVHRTGQRAANASCRKRLQRRRERVGAAHDFLETVTPDLSLESSCPALAVASDRRSHRNWRGGTGMKKATRWRRRTFCCLCWRRITLVMLGRFPLSGPVARCKECRAGDYQDVEIALRSDYFQPGTVILIGALPHEFINDLDCDAPAEN